MGATGAREASVLRLRVTQLQQQLDRCTLALQQKSAEANSLTGLLEKVAVEKGEALDERDELRSHMSKASAGGGKRGSLAEFFGFPLRAASLLGLPPTPVQWLVPSPSQMADKHAHVHTELAQLQSRVEAAECESREWHSVVMGAEAQIATLEKSLQAARARAEGAEKQAREKERQVRLRLCLLHVQGGIPKPTGALKPCSGMRVVVLASGLRARLQVNKPGNASLQLVNERTDAERAASALREQLASVSQRASDAEAEARSLQQRLQQAQAAASSRQVQLEAAVTQAARDAEARLRANEAGAEAKEAELRAQLQVCFEASGLLCSVLAATVLCVLVRPACLESLSSPAECFGGVRRQPVYSNSQKS